MEIVDDGRGEKKKYEKKNENEERKKRKTVSPFKSFHHGGHL
jgi:hypothetical protein